VVGVRPARRTPASQPISISVYLSVRSQPVHFTAAHGGKAIHKQIAFSVVLTTNLDTSCISTLILIFITELTYDIARHFI
jgi:hypothetical protein